LSRVHIARSAHTVISDTINHVSSAFVMRNTPNY
jgi:hypothetical protein